MPWPPSRAGPLARSTEEQTGCPLEPHGKATAPGGGGSESGLSPPPLSLLMPASLCVAPHLYTTLPLPRSLSLHICTCLHVTPYPPCSSTSHPVTPHPYCFFHHSSSLPPSLPPPPSPASPMMDSVHQKHSNSDQLAEDFQLAFRGCELADVVFIVGEERMPLYAVKAILACRSR